MNKMSVGKGRFKDKHPSDARADPEIVTAVNKRRTNGMITCADAAAIAAELRKSLPEVGVVIDLLDYSLSACQLGLFGYHPRKKIVLPARSVTKEMEAEINQCVMKGALPCEAAWKIAEKFSLPKMDISSACEAMDIKIKPCQLGAF
jgi:hypothetical protein